jgi:hypothetical protein
MNPTAARVTALLIGQDAFRDERGRAHVIGIFDSIGATQLPMGFQFAIYCRLNGEGSHVLVLRVLDPHGRELVRSEPIDAQLLPVQGHQFFMNLGLEAREEGVHLVQAILDNDLAQEAPLLVEMGSDEDHQHEGVAPIDFSPH